MPGSLSSQSLFAYQFSVFPSTLRYCHTMIGALRAAIGPTKPTDWVACRKE
jgi:hypothetical protein